MTKPQKYYSLTSIQKKDAVYNVIFGERSNGKTYAALLHCLKDYVANKRQMAYVRRWKEDITGRRGSQLFSGICENDEVRKATDGAFSGVHFYAGKWYLCNYDDNGKAIYGDTDILAFAFALSDSEHDKSTSFPNVGNIVFDEFLSKATYLADEFVLFMNVVSTIVRRRTDVKIYMLGNTVNKFAPYFKEMGLTNITKMEQGTIDVYRYGDGTLTVAVEYCKTTSEESREANRYFAFDNPKLEMITGGAWELNIYPHLPYKYTPNDVLFRYFIEFADHVFQAQVIGINGTWFTYIHPKTSPIKDPDSDLIYSLDFHPEVNYNRSIFKPTNRVQEKVLWFFNTDRVFYSDNSTGDAIANYLKTCKRL